MFSYVCILSTAREYQKNHAEVERDQFTGTAKSVSPLKATILGAASVGRGYLAVRSDRVCHN